MERHEQNSAKWVVLGSRLDQNTQAWSFSHEENEDLFLVRALYPA